jgi:hypothetical protein
LDLLKVHLSQEHKRKGMMSAIFEKALDEARIRGLQYVTLNTYPDKLRGLKLGIWAEMILMGLSAMSSGVLVGETDRFGIDLFWTGPLVIRRALSIQRH